VSVTQHHFKCVLFRDNLLINGVLLRVENSYRNSDSGEEPFPDRLLFPELNLIGKRRKVEALVVPNVFIEVVCDCSLIEIPV